MTVVPAWPTAVAWLSRAALAVKEFVRPLDPSEREAIDPRLSMPPCVWYGRCVFCFHVPLSSPALETDEPGFPSGQQPSR